MQMKVDEDLPREVADALRRSGHDAHTVVEQGLQGTSDGELWRNVQREKRCLVTADKGFADVRGFPPGTHDRIVLLRLPRESRSGYVRLIEQFLVRIDPQSVRGTITVVTPELIRVHRGS